MALTIKCSKILEDVHLGDSIAVNGICLTVTDFTKNQFTVDVMPETVKATSLNDLTKGSKVNLERAMAATAVSEAISSQAMSTELRKSHELKRKATQFTMI